MPVVTISRGSKSGGKALAEQVAREIGAPCIGREVLLEAAARLGVPEPELIDKMERGPGILERAVVERRAYIAATQAALAEHAAGGDLVYHGLAGHLLLRGVPGVLRVRLIAPLEMRIRAVIDERAMSWAEAERHIRQIDEQRVRWTRVMYGAYILDPQLYDLVINLENLTVPSAAAIVVATLRRPEFVPTQETAARLTDFALACRVRAALAADIATRGLALDVEASRGLVTVRGEVPRAGVATTTTSRCEADVRRVVTAVPGAERARFDLSATTSFV